MHQCAQGGNCLCHHNSNRHVTRILLLQLPIPQLNFGRRTGNIPMAAACLKQAVHGMPDLSVEILPEIAASYLGDSALVRLLVEKKPDIVGFTLFNWNVERSIHIARRIKAACKLKIVFGGPEVTPDNTMNGLSIADFLVYGEGESIFRQLLQDDRIWNKGKGEGISENIFQSAKSPYVEGLLDPSINRLMYLETQRGCPFRCGFCYYNKSMKQPARAAEDVVIQAVEWGLRHQVEELCILDPSLNSRPDLPSLLGKIGAINTKKAICISGETRAEQIDNHIADLFAHAGFSLFEIGLQSTNPEALRIMNRKTDLPRFLNGTALLKERGILPRIDLIVGLPGDTLDTFRQSVDFIAAHDLFDDIMVFPLSVLPGTDFRKNHQALQLTFEDSPPYSIVRTPAFSREDMLSAFDYAEEIFDISLFPDPHMDVSFRTVSAESPVHHHQVTIHGREYISKLLITPESALPEIVTLSARLTHPYQVFITPDVSDKEHVKHILGIVSGENPHTPFEIVFLEPAFPVHTEELLSAVRIKRPHYLDNDLRFLYDTSGNRAVIFTLVSSHETIFFSGAMKRQVFWWKQSILPSKSDLDGLSDFSGILIDTRHSDHEIQTWQDRFAGFSSDILLINFAKTKHQKRWINLAAGDDYYADVL
ncbi:MAG: radical SAM protein [Desulfobacteraceae bacterium]|nr:MAG: radical SAM protein [Desulfobacteraceae bacterium]